MSSTPERPIFMEQESVQRAENFAVRNPRDFRRSFTDQVKIAINIAPDCNANLLLLNGEPPAIGVEAMWVEFFGEEPQQFFYSLLEAARRGFNVEIHRDWYSQTILDEEFLFFPPTKLGGRNRKRHRMWVSGFNEKRREILERSGGVVIETNPPQGRVDTAQYLFKGRNHKKIFFVTRPDSVVAWTGGMNLAREHFKLLDYMVEFTDPDIVYPLVDEFSRINENRRTESEEIRCTEDTSILVDALGDESIIARKAIDVVDEAQGSLYIMSALHPEGKFLDALNRARDRGVHVAFVTVNPKFAGILWGAQSALTDTKATLRGKRIPLLLPERKLVHGKMIVADEKEAIVGSSNFTPAPHEELSVYSSNPKLVENLIGFLHSTVGKDNLEQRVNKDTVIKLPDAHEL